MTHNPSSARSGLQNVGFGGQVWPETDCSTTIEVALPAWTEICSPAASVNWHTREALADADPAQLKNPLTEGDLTTTDGIGGSRAGMTGG